MRAMPFRTASDSAVTFAPPALELDGTLFKPGDPATAWDYLTRAKVHGSVQIDSRELLRSTALETLEPLSVFLQVDCPSTGFRGTATAPVSVNGPGSEVHVELELHPHTVANELEVRYGLVLTRQLPANERMTPFQRGSRVYSHGRTYRFHLEGEGSGFPTEAFDFEAAGFPAGAPWHLSFQHESLHDPFMASVRLFINTSHPASEALLSAKPGPAQSVLLHGILEQLILTVADEDEELDEFFDEGSIGTVLDDLCQTYLGKPLAAVRTALKSDRDRTLTKLRDTAGLLGETK